MKRTKKFLIAILVVVSLLNIIPAAKTNVYAASNGDKKSYTKTLTLAEVNTICNKLAGVTSSVGAASTVTSAAITLAGAGLSTGASIAIGFLTMGVSALATTDVKNEYNFYNNIRTTMINKKYSKVTIKYNQIYRVNKMYGDFVGGWYANGHSVVQYYK